MPRKWAVKNVISMEMGSMHHFLQKVLPSLNPDETPTNDRLGTNQINRFLNLKKGDEEKENGKIHNE